MKNSDSLWQPLKKGKAVRRRRRSLFLKHRSTTKLNLLSGSASYSLHFVPEHGPPHVLDMKSLQYFLNII